VGQSNLLIRPVLLTILVFVPLGCADVRRGDVPEPRALGRDLPAYHAPDPSAEDAGTGTATTADPEGDLALRDALGAALLGSPHLASASWDRRAAEARALQASLYPNPEVEIEVENIGFSGELSGFSLSETSLLVSQPIPLGGRIGRRTEAANLETRLSGWDYEAARLDVLTEVTKTLVEVLSAQELVALTKETAEVNEEVRRVVAEKVLAGKTPPLEEQKAAVEASLAKLRHERALRDLEAARQRLAATWGSTHARFTTVRGDFYVTHPVPTAERLVTGLSKNPDLARWDDAIALRNAEVAAARSEAWPDLTLTGGVRRIEELGIYSYILGISIPLPLIDRNQGGILEASADTRKAREEKREADARIRSEFIQAWQALELAGRQAETLRDQVLPSARSAFEASREGFKRGKFGYLDVLDAQRTLFEAREGQIDALAEYHAAAADVERLIGRSLRSIEHDQQNSE